VTAAAALQGARRYRYGAVAPRGRTRSERSFGATGEECRSAVLARALLVTASDYLDEAVRPPSTYRICPEMYDAFSETRNATASAMSTGLPIRRSGTI